MKFDHIWWKDSTNRWTS